MTISSLGFSLQIFDEVDSTNTQLVGLARAGAPNRTVILAKKQLAGRGRDGRSWVSESGNLHASWLERVDVVAEIGGQLVYVVALAVHDALAECGVETQLKWPNDVLCDGKKLAGILLESAIKAGCMEYVVVGLGLNAGHIPDDVADIASRLEADILPESLLEKILLHYDRWFSCWREEGFEPVRFGWNQRAAFVGQEIVVRTKGESLSGVMVGLGDNGALLLQNGDEICHALVGDIFVSDDAASD